MAWLRSLWHRLLWRSASESGRLCHGDGGHEGSARRRRALMLPVLLEALQFAGSMYYVLFTERPCGSGCWPPGPSE
jgi:hypothetical protein